MDHAQIKTTAVLVTVTLVFGLLASHAKAGERKPSRADYQNLEDIKDNQKIISKCREDHNTLKNGVTSSSEIQTDDVDCYNKFTKAKEWNRLEVKALAENDWIVDWSTMTLVDAQKAPAKKPSKASPVSVPPSKPSSTVWKWKDAPSYKNEVLEAYQKKLQARGIKDTKIFVAQLIQENGALAPDVIGDKGCSFGIIQYNACAKHRVNAKKFLADNPEWKTIDKQLDWMADSVALRVQKYPTIKQAVVSHNCPVCALHAVDSKAGYYASISKRLSLLSL